MTKLHEIAQLGQSIWYDNIQRSILKSGEFQGLLDKGVRGVTSNPTIFDKAISGSSDYDEDIARLAQEDKSIEDIFEGLALADIGEAADMLRGLYDESAALDGYVSIEVSPKLADETEQTIAQARRLFATLDRPNIMIKVPATEAGFPAIETLIGDGININVTLIFSMEQYEKTVEAYIAGLEKRAAAGGDVSKIASVASFFVSRVDGVADKQLEAVGNQALQGKAAIANARVAYGRFLELFAGERWEKLTAKGARVQRPLWASTGTKNPSYPKTLYADTLFAPHTVNTVPPATLEAILEEATVALTLEAGIEEAKAQLQQLAEAGVDLDKITAELLEAGVASFIKSFESLMASIEAKRDQLVAG
jgi:transaldolase